MSTQARSLQIAQGILARQHLYLVHRLIEFRFCPASDKDAGPSCTKRFAVARPIPQLPLVIVFAAATVFLNEFMSGCPIGASNAASTSWKTLEEVTLNRCTLISFVAILHLHPSASTP